MGDSLKRSGETKGGCSFGLSESADKFPSTKMHLVFKSSTMTFL
jgi:hypothetical protein